MDPEGVERGEVAADAIEADDVLNQLDQLCPVLPKAFNHSSHVTDRGRPEREQAGVARFGHSCGRQVASVPASAPPTRTQLATTSQTVESTSMTSRADPGLPPRDQARRRTSPTTASSWRTCPKVKAGGKRPASLRGRVSSGRSVDRGLGGACASQLSARHTTPGGHRHHPGAPMRPRSPCPPPPPEVCHLVGLVGPWRSGVRLWPTRRPRRTRGTGQLRRSVSCRLSRQELVGDGRWPQQLTVCDEGVSGWTVERPASDELANDSRAV